MRLPGIGPALAARIAAHRTTTGPFTTLDDLLVIPGISAAKLATIRPAAVAHPPATQHSADDHTADDQPAPDRATDETNATGPAATEPPIDINIATTTELVRLPGIGPALAARIAAHRTTTGPFTTLDDLLVIPGISAAKLATIRQAAASISPRPTTDGLRGSEERP